MKIHTPAQSPDEPCPHSSEPALSVRRALLLINPNSRRGAETNLEAVIQLLESSGFQLTRREPDTPEQSVRELDRHCAGVDLVMVAGGDGTISSVVPWLYRHKKPLAILPLGTANDLARSLSIPQDLEEAAHLVVENHQRRIDLGVVNEHFFLNAVHIGLGTKVTHQLNRKAKKLWGAFSYLGALWSTVSRSNSFRVTITIDGRTWHQRSIHLTIGNGRFYGGGNVVEENAQIDSGRLCLYSIKPQPRWKLIFLAPLVRLGKQRLASRTFGQCGKHVEISTTKPLEVHADGELVGRTPATLDIIPQALSVYSPPDRSPVPEPVTGGFDS